MTVAALFSKVNLKVIVADHWRTLVNDTTGRTSLADIAVFYVAPAAAALAAGFANVVVPDNAIDVMTNALAIFAGLLFNLLALMQGFTWRDSYPLADTARRFTVQVYNNIAYAIVVSLTSLVPLIVASYYPLNSLGRLVAGSAAVFLVIHFGLTMCMVLKRMHGMLQQEAQKPRG